DANPGSNSNSIAGSLLGDNSSAACARARYSASFPGLEDARKSLTGAGTEFHRQQRSLFVRKPSNSRRGEREQVLHFAAAEWPTLRRRLNLYKMSAAGHHHVHVHFRASIFFISKVE